MHEISIACSPGISESALESNQKMFEGLTTVGGLGDHDVLCGRGNGINKRRGNIEFRKHVEEKRMAYNAAPRKEKMQIARQVVQWIQDKGGRFLRYKEDMNEEVFVDIGFKRSVEKASQALRETGRKTKENQGSKLKEAQAAVAKVKKSAARAGFQWTNKTSCLWQEAVHFPLVHTESGESNCSSDDDTGQFEDAVEESAEGASTPPSAVHAERDEMIHPFSFEPTHQSLLSPVHEKQDAMIQAYSLDSNLQAILSLKEEDDNSAMIEAIPYQANPREKPGVLLPPRWGSDSSASCSERVSKQRAPIHDLMVQPTQSTNTQLGNVSGWFVDYFTNGGSGDTTPEANRKYWEELFLALASFKEMHGHCCIPPSACSPHPGCSREEREHARLADWASMQRQLFREIKQGRRSATDEEKTRLKRLEALGFVLNYEDWHWNNKFNELVEFQKREEERKRKKGKGEVGNELWKDRTEFTKCLGLALWVKEQRSLYAQGLQGKFHVMPAERVRRLEQINFSWVDDASRKSQGTSPQSVAALACSLCNATAKTSLAKRAGKAAGPSYDWSILREDEVTSSAVTKSANTAEPANGVPSASNGKLVKKVGPCTTLSPISYLSSPQSEHHSVEKKATFSPDTPVLETPPDRNGAVTPESPSMSRSLLFSFTSH